MAKQSDRGPTHKESLVWEEMGGYQSWNIFPHQENSYYFQLWMPFKNVIINGEKNVNVKLHKIRAFKVIYILEMYQKAA